MKRDNYKTRIIDKKIERYLSTFGAVCVEGPKWCGKTWTSSYHCSSAIYIGDPEGGYQNRRLAEMSPSLVLGGQHPRLIDEWQEVPPLWDAIRYKVDQNPEKGQYILTGSSTPNHKGILHSGAGRIARLKMSTMSLFESGDSTGIVSLKDIVNGLPVMKMTGEVELKKIIEYIVRGGWPGSIDLSIEDASLIPKEYVDAILNDDIYRVDNIKRDLNKMHLLLRSLARNESTCATNKTLKNDIKAMDDEDININTIADYLNIFDRLFLTNNIKPFSLNVRSSMRLKQAEKRHLCDPSLACALLNLTPSMLMNDLETLGLLFESLCLRDLKIYAEAMDAHLYHYQDYQNKEIDAVIETNEGKWCAIEIKLGANQIEQAAKNLNNIYKKLEKEENANLPSMMCIICGLSNAAYQREDGIYVIPITALKD